MLEMNGYNSSFSRQQQAHDKWKEDTGQTK